MAQTPKITRDISNLVAALRRHLTLLEEYSNRAFRNGDESFFGEVAGKLRVLTYGSRTNRPLLLSLMEELSIEIPVTISRPRGEIQMTLSEYMNGLAFAIQTPTRGMVQVSKSELVATWAQQYGASHEDWEINEEFSEVLKTGIFLGGLPAAAACLRAISNTVLWVGIEFLNQIDSKCNS